MLKHSTTTTTEYKTLECVGLPKHRIGVDGSLWSSAKKWKEGVWRQIKTHQWGRYTYATITYEGRDRMFRVSRLVLLAFIGSCPEGMQACHNNGNSFDNRLENLRWDTPKENQRDRVKHGTHTEGTRNGRAKLTEEQVREIRRLYAAGGISQSKLGKRYGVGQDIISGIVRRATWKCVE